MDTTNNFNYLSHFPSANLNYWLKTDTFYLHILLGRYNGADPFELDIILRFRNVIHDLGMESCHLYTISEELVQLVIIRSIAAV